MTVSVEKEEVVGSNMPVFVLLMGKYKEEALNATAKDWSTHVSAVLNQYIHV